MKEYYLCGMQFIPENIIDAQAEAIGNPELFGERIKHFQEAQPAILAYLFSENFDLLTQEEKEYLIYLALVIWSAVDQVAPELATVITKSIDEKEEANWEQLKDVKAKQFRDRLDVFFDNYTQEDLLAFAEDALVHDEDKMVTNEGREYIFIALKTIIDCLEAA